MSTEISVLTHWHFGAATVPSGGMDVDDLLRRGLDWIARIAPYDLATVFALVGDRLVVRAARGCR